MYTIMRPGRVVQGVGKQKQSADLAGKGGQVTDALHLTYFLLTLQKW